MSNTLEISSHVTSEEGLTDIPAVLAPPPAVPPIQGFERLITRPPAPAQEAAAYSGSTSMTAESVQLLSSAPATPPQQQQQRPVKRRLYVPSAPPRGVFSFRTSAAVLALSPPARSGGREVELAHWEAAVYPTGATSDDDRELERIIDELGGAHRAASGNSAGPAASERADIVMELSESVTPNSAVTPTNSPVSTSPEGAHTRFKSGDRVNVPTAVSSAPRHAPYAADLSSPESAATDSDGDQIFVYSMPMRIAPDTWGAVQPPRTELEGSPCNLQSRARSVSRRGKSSPSRKRSAPAADPTHRDISKHSASAVPRLHQGITNVPYAHVRAARSTGTSPERRRASAVATAAAAAAAAPAQAALVNPNGSLLTHTATNGASSDVRPADAPGDSAAEPHLATEGRVAAAAARRQRREEREQQHHLAEGGQAARARQVQRARGSTAADSAAAPAASRRPRGFEAFAEEGRRKRQLMEELERLRRLKAEGNFTFKPVISTKARRPRRAASVVDTAVTPGEGVSDGSSSTLAPPPPPTTAARHNAFLASGAEWQARRAANLEAAIRRRDEEEEAASGPRFVNEETERILERRAAVAAASGGGAPGRDLFRRLYGEVGELAEHRRELEAKYTPSFAPEILSSSLPANRPSVIPPEARGLPPEKDEAGCDTGSHHSGDAPSLAQGDGDGAAAAPPSPRGPQRTKGQIARHIAQMEERDAERQARLAALTGRDREAAAVVRAAAAALAVSEQSSVLAQRGRQRMNARDELKRAADKAVAAAAEEAARLEVRSRTTRPVPAPLPPTFEARERRAEERKAQRTEQLRRQLLAREMAQCTFKPQVSRASEELAARAGYQERLNDTELHIRTTGSAQVSPVRSVGRAGRSISPAIGTEVYTMCGHSYPPSSVRSRATESVTDSPQPIRPQPRARGLASDGRTPPRTTESLSREVEDLEKIMHDWKELGLATKQE